VLQVLVLQVLLVLKVLVLKVPWTELERVVDSASSLEQNETRAEFC
jgi:hypothetical protein